MTTFWGGSLALLNTIDDMTLDIATHNRHLCAVLLIMENKNKTHAQKKPHNKQRDKNW
jgi:hypothetical protein